ncbi:MAG: G1 family endopeptidase [Pseudomonadota bacterium]|nr:G1 family endopeptidase [Pseudomonadota bacterium]
MPDDRNIQPRKAPNELASPRRYSVAPFVHTPITLRTLPYAICSVHAEGTDDPKHSLKVYADGEGVVRFHVQPSTITHDIARLEVDCAANGSVVRYPLHLRVSVGPNADMPAPPLEKPMALRHDVRVRPPLSADDAMSLTDQAALARGYPSRPNPDEVPKAFNAWLRCVSMPGYRIEPQLMSNPDVTHGKAKKHSTANFTNWCGFERLRSLQFSPTIGGGVGLSDPYDWVTGTWHVPFVTGEQGIKTYSALWVGLDGDGTTDLVQAGTEQEATSINLGFVHFTLTNYYAWTEFLPQQPTEQVITNFTVSPGDEIFTEVWVGTGDNEPSLSGASGRFFIMNLTTGAFASISAARAPTTVSGREAVWIMERPTVGGALPDLANYGSSLMYNASARKANSPRYQGYVPYLGGNNKQDTMVNSAAGTLSTVTAIDSSSMRFDWKAFK